MWNVHWRTSRHIGRWVLRRGCKCGCDSSVNRYLCEQRFCTARSRWISSTKSTMKKTDLSLLGMIAGSLIISDPNLSPRLHTHAACLDSNPTLITLPTYST